MNENRTVETGRLAGGVALIVIGVLFLLDRFTFLDFGDVVRSYWPMIVVILGVTKLFSRVTVWNGLWLIAVGSWLQLANLNLFGVTYGNSWPLLLIALGGGMVLRALVETAFPREGDHERHEA